MKPLSGTSQTAFRATIVLIFAALVLWRMPLIVLHGGRFWAEEGAVYFSNAWNRPWYAAWFAIHTGYLNFAAGCGTWIGLRLGGVAHAPLVTVVLALLIQCLPVYAILTHEFPWRRSLVGSAAAVLLCAAPPVMGEVWLNTITSQFHLALFAALVLAAPAAGRVLFRLDCAVLALAVLSGPATSFLMPLFVLKALRERDTKAIVPALIVFLGFCLQATIYLFHVMPERGHRLGAAALLSAISLHTIVLQFAGLHLAQTFADHLTALHAQHRLLLAGPAIFLGFYGLVALAIWRVRDAALAWLLAAAMLIAFVSFYEALDGTFEGFMQVGGGQRYAFIPVVINSLLVVGLGSARGGWLGKLFLAAAVVLVAVAVHGDRQGSGMFADGPAWQPQIAAWRHDPARVLVIWPGNPWAITLAPR